MYGINDEINWSHIDNDIATNTGTKKKNRLQNATIHKKRRSKFIEIIAQPVHCEFDHLHAVLHFCVLPFLRRVRCTNI